MQLTIKSRKLNRNFEFWAPDSGGYIFLESEGRPASLGQQICQGGGFTGSTLSARSPEDFEAQCRAWYRAHLRAVPDWHWRYVD